MFPILVSSRPYFLEQRFLFSWSMIVLAISGMGIIVLNTISKTNKNFRHMALMKSLWKLESNKSSEVSLKEQRQAWYKLVCAGFMMTSLGVSMMIRFLPTDLVLIIAFSLLILWITYLFHYWYSVVCTTRGQIDDASSKISSNSNEGVSSWLSRQKTQVKDERLPVTILTGYLGSGKTTLLQHILTNTAGLKILVIENEIGEQGVDHELLMKHAAKEDIVLMNNGCVCCTVRNDLLTTFHRMFSNEAFSKLDWIVIETTGLADPAPLIQSFYMDAECQKRMRIDSVITVVDCKHLPHHLASKDQKVGAHGDVSEAIRQISYADRIVVNKIDLVGRNDVQSLIKSIADINPFAKIFECSHGKIDITELLNICAFDAKRFQSLYSEKSPKSIFIQRDETGKISKEKIRVRIGAADGSQRKGNISSFSFVTKQPIDINKFNEWISLLLQTHGANIYRMKGILHMHTYEEIFVCHGVHMIFDGEKTTSKWGNNRDRESKLVFIGADLHKDQLEEGFKSTFID